MATTLAAAVRDESRPDQTIPHRQSLDRWNRYWQRGESWPGLQQHPKPGPLWPDQSLHGTRSHREEHAASLLARHQHHLGPCPTARRHCGRPDCRGRPGCHMHQHHRGRGTPLWRSEIGFQPTFRLLSVFSGCLASPSGIFRQSGPLARDWLQVKRRAQKQDWGNGPLGDTFREVATRGTDQELPANHERTIRCGFQYWHEVTDDPARDPRVGSRGLHPRLAKADQPAFWRPRSVVVVIAGSDSLLSAKLRTLLPELLNRCGAAVRNRPTRLRTTKRRESTREVLRP